MDKVLTYILGIVAGAGLFACSSNDEVNPGVADSVRKDLPLSGAEIQLAQRQYEFPINLLASANELNQVENILLSPLSASMVLGMMTNAVAPGEREELLKVLKISEEEIDAYNELVYKLHANLPGIDPHSDFSINNALWFSVKGNLSDAYSGILKNNFFADIVQYDKFDLSVVNNINEWINNKTNGGIKKLLDESDASADNLYAWVNALYFKGAWTQKFNKDATQKAAFYQSFPDESETAKVDMMTGYNFRYVDYMGPENSYDEKDYVISVMLPYGNESFIFTAVLPSENNPDISSTLALLTPEYWQRIDEICKYQQERGNIIVELPKMKLEKTTDLIPVMQNAGLNSIFTGINITESMGLDNTYISLFKQKVVFDADEEGSEIKAATVAGGIMATLPNHIVFNRPFIYFVRERTTGAVLLAGVYRQP